MYNKNGLFALLIISLTAGAHAADWLAENSGARYSGKTYSWRDFENPEVLKRFDGLTRKEEQEIFITVLRQDIFADENPWALSEACINEIIDCNQTIIDLDIDCMLRDYGVNTDTRIIEEQTDSERNNPFHIIAQHGTLAHALVAKDRYLGDLLLWKNKAGKTPIDLAKECKKRDVLELLTEALEEYNASEAVEYEYDKAEWKRYQQGYSSNDDDELAYKPFPWHRRY